MKKIIALLALACAPSLQAQQLPDSGSFFVRLGRDTIAVERYTLTRHQLVAEALLRTPVTRHLKLTVTFKDDGTLSWYEIVNSPVPGTPASGPVTRGIVTLMGDSAQVLFSVAGTARSPRMISANSSMLPIQIPFYSPYEVALKRARKTPADTILNMLAANAPLHFRIAFPRADSVTLFQPQSGTTVAKLDKDGRMTLLNAEGTTFKVMVTRSQPVSLAPYAKRFAKADSAGKSIGFLSPLDTVDISVGAGNVEIHYSKPSKRGRVIFGGIVPWDQVWRTGANAATSILIENKTMQIGDTKIPPGKYTLWTLPSKTGWQLIFNKQTGQWGTIYDEKQDLVRIPVKTESVAVPVETFAIDVVRAKQPGEATLTLTWDRTRIVVPFRMVD